MPELPDLIYIEKKLSNFLPGKTVVATKVTEPIVIRNNLGRKFEDAFTGCSFTQLFRRGPFLGFRFDAPLEIIIHPMLAGRFYIESPQIEKSSRPPGAKDLCFRMELSDSGAFAYYDDKKMGKVYLIEKGNYSSIAKFENQGPYILGEEFTFDVFQKIVSSRRQQVRAFLLDQTNISSVGNAYGDEILFAAGIHPKTFCHQLSQEEKQKLFDSILSVMREGIEAVETAAKSVDIKVRDHMKVRNRKKTAPAVERKSDGKMFSVMMLSSAPPASPRSGISSLTGKSKFFPESVFLNPESFSLGLYFRIPCCRNGGQSTLLELKCTTLN